MNFQTRVENALAATIEPLHINRECQGLRQQRVATDDCDDPVDRDLAKEIGVIQSSADLLKAEGFLKHDILKLILYKIIKYYKKIMKYYITIRSKIIFLKLIESDSCENQRADT